MWAQEVRQLNRRHWNLNPAYDRERMRLFGERLLKREGAYLRFYSRASLEDLLEKTY